MDRIGWWVLYCWFMRKRRCVRKRVRAGYSFSLHQSTEMYCSLSGNYHYERSSFVWCFCIVLLSAVLVACSCLAFLWCAPVWCSGDVLLSGAPVACSCLLSMLRAPVWCTCVVLLLSGDPVGCSCLVFLWRALSWCCCMGRTIHYIPDLLL